MLCRHASHPQRHDDPSSGTCSYTPISSRSISQSALRSLITCGSAPLSGIDTQRKSLGSAARLLSEFFKPPCSFETNGRHRPRPASAQNPAGRDHRLRFVLSFSGSHRTRWLAGWRPRASLPPAPGGPCVSCSCHYQTNLVRSRGSFEALLSLACRPALNGGHSQGCNVRARFSFYFLSFLSILSFGGLAGSNPPELYLSRVQRSSLGTGPSPPRPRHRNYGNPAPLAIIDNLIPNRWEFLQLLE